MNKLHALTAIVLLMTGTAAAQPADLPEPGAVPGDFFYGLERASEALELAVASAPIIGSEELQAKVRANHAAERLAEARELADRNKTEKVEALMEQYQENMNKSFKTANASGKTEFAQRLGNVSNNQVDVLQEVEKKVPEQAKAGIQRAIENNRKNMEEIERRRRAERPGKQVRGAKPETPETTPDAAVNVSVDNRTLKGNFSAPGENPSPPGTTEKTGGVENRTPEKGKERPDAEPEVGNGTGQLENRSENKTENLSEENNPPELP